VEQLYQAFGAAGLTSEQFLGHKYLRLKQIRKLQDEGRLNGDIRWQRTSRPVVAPA
jgi:hypothetical protein